MYKHRKKTGSYSWLPSTIGDNLFNISFGGRARVGAYVLLCVCVCLLMSKTRKIQLKITFSVLLLRIYQSISSYFLCHCSAPLILSKRCWLLRVCILQSASERTKRKGSENSKRFFFRYILFSSIFFFLSATFFHWAHASKYITNNVIAIYWIVLNRRHMREYWKRIRVKKKKKILSTVVRLSRFGWFEPHNNIPALCL